VPKCWYEPRVQNKIEEEVLLPRGIELKEIFGMELPPKDVVNGLQFLELCRVFGKVWFHVNFFSCFCFD